MLSRSLEGEQHQGHDHADREPDHHAEQDHPTVERRTIECVRESCADPA